MKTEICDNKCGRTLFDQQGRFIGLIWITQDTDKHPRGQEMKVCGFCYGELFNSAVNAAQIAKMKAARLKALKA